MDDGQKVITIAHPEHSSGELKIPKNNIITGAMEIYCNCTNVCSVLMFANFVVSINPQTFMHANHIFLYRNIKAILQIHKF